MTIGAILTQGLGSFGTVNLLPTLGYLSNDTPPVPPNNIPQGGAGYPSSIYWGVRKHKKFTKNLDWLLDRVVSEYYEELTEADRPKAVQKEAAKIVRPYAKDGQKVPQQVNWQALYADAEAVIKLLELYRRERELDDDEEQWLMLH